MRNEKVNISLIKSFPVGVVVSCFNYKITSLLKNSTLSYMDELGFFKKDIILIEVPGAIEIPLIVKKLAISNKVKVIITLGSVIKGSTDHYNYVCQQVSYGCQKISITFNIPVIFGILTTDNEKQALERIDGKLGYKGREVVDCALSMYNILNKYF
ncbi:6,7-dimethyl-8-ribityllumazine synthase [Candidatus Legionella polyplacis]|uniref:6,7-dimethyl-8-ribityllumazine synthase n=1 Tax=Candidatus Legionella polyplacis TaxID=2005262 RepID=A0ABZ2GYW1_9GAMM|nr:6,7-dimethyl-8-ribityllumazine synthase [Candidatus Legionella polyplacis]ATW01628.1 6,7-dimethyl-8-ribityllumazine synthase [Candidatus Legionella polyplacis]